MESPNEAARLVAKSDLETSRDQLLLTGLIDGMTAVDAGCGAGVVSGLMASIVGRNGKVIGLDGSLDRIAFSKDAYKDVKNIDFVQTNLESISLPDEISDYTFSRFVFEYLRAPKLVFHELLRITKPGGRLVIGDLDYNVMSHHPLPFYLTVQLEEIVEKLGEKRIWDAYAGRKLYSYFFVAGLKDIRVHLIPHHLIYGELQKLDRDNWLAKLQAIKHYQERGQIKLGFDIEHFGREFMKFFDDPSRFSYTPLILVEGVKA
jgi:ubiquinone/menaquinone biosynthesis C-methylase UbiE